ncbi:hypothetical protein LIER_29470 [Lithospermum erythrorhizon]|uniref:Uncharacterized protein n=1 Tax=Lithospermum erythrorhizon TaxID=34254 RepID=A0AAV3RJ94_LITER
MNDIQRLDANAHLGLSERPAKHWSRSHFRCAVKCDILLNNICETLNKQILVAREKLLEDNKSNATAYSKVWNYGNEFEVYHANVKGCKYKCQKPEDLVDDY